MNAPLARIRAGLYHFFFEYDETESMRQYVGLVIGLFTIGFVFWFLHTVIWGWNLAGD